MKIECYPKHKGLSLNQCSDGTLIGLRRSGLVMRSHTKPAIAMPTHSQVKKLKRLMTEKISWEMAYIMDRRHYRKMTTMFALFDINIEDFH